MVRNQIDDEEVGYLACGACNSVGIAYTYCECCEDSGMVHDVALPKKRRPWWTKVKRSPPEPRARDYSVVREGDQVLMVKGTAGEVLQRGRVKKLHAVMMSVEYWHWRTGAMKTTRKYRSSVVGLRDGVQVTRDKEGMTWVGVTEVTSPHGVVSDDEEENAK